MVLDVCLDFHPGEGAKLSPPSLIESAMIILSARRTWIIASQAPPIQATPVLAQTMSGIESIRYRCAYADPAVSVRIAYPQTLINNQIRGAKQVRANAELGTSMGVTGTSTLESPLILSVRLTPLPGLPNIDSPTFTPAQVYVSIGAWII